MSNWRTSAVGAVLILFAVARIAIEPKSILDAETISLVTGACSLFLGSDRLLGHKADRE